MKSFAYVLAALFAITSGMRAETLFCRPGLGTGSNDGSDWTNAWQDFDDIVWDADQGGQAGELGPGDKLIIAGGTSNETFYFGANGTAANPITIKRAISSDGDATGAAGWSAAFDAQLVIDKTQAAVGTYVHYAHDAVPPTRGKYSGFYWFNADSEAEMPATVYGSNIIIDGSEASGILIKFDGMGRDQVGACVFDQTSGVATDKPCRDGPLVASGYVTSGSSSQLENITLKFIEVEGPARGAKYLNGSWPSEPVSEPGLRFFKKGGGSGLLVDGLTVQNCEFWGLLSFIRMRGCNNVLVERCEGHTFGNDFPDNGGPPYDYPIAGGSYDAPHASLTSNRGNTNVEYRYNYFHHFESPSGVSLYDDSDSDYKIHGNVLYNPPNEEYTGGARGFAAIIADPAGPVTFYNNTLVNINFPYTIYPQAVNAVYTDRNNIRIGATKFQDPNNLVDNDWNYVDEDRSGSADDEPNWSLGVTESIFVGAPLSTSSTYNDFRLASATPGGEVLGSAYEVDADGNTRGSGGVWDQGAFQFVEGSPGDPIIDLSVTNIDFGPIKVGATSDLTVDVANIGTGTLSGTATESSTEASLLNASYSVTDTPHTVTIRAAPTATGHIAGTVSFSGGGGATLNFEMLAYDDVADTTLPIVVTLATEAAVKSPVVVVDAATDYISQAGVTTYGINPNNGWFVFSFAVPSTDDYIFYLDGLFAANEFENGLHWRIDAEPTAPDYIMDTPISASEQNNVKMSRRAGATEATYEANLNNPEIVNLTAGTHVFYGRGRDADTGMTQIRIVSATGSAPPNPVSKPRQKSGSSLILLGQP